jgi:hypothetical protein
MAIAREQKIITQCESLEARIQKIEDQREDELDRQTKQARDTLLGDDHFNFLGEIKHY